MKKFILISALLFSFNGWVQVTDEIHERCKDVADYVGCVQIFLGSVPKAKAANANYRSISKVAPMYPKELLRKRIEGNCIVRFTITKEGTTEDIKVVQCTDYDFANSSIEAAKKFKYAPKIVDGNPRQTVGVIHKMSFELASSQK